MNNHIFMKINIVLVFTKTEPLRYMLFGEIHLCSCQEWPKNKYALNGINYVNFNNLG